MRLAQVTLPEGSREQVLSLLEEHDIDYVLTEATSDPNYEGVVFFPVPTQAVESILESLHEIGIDEDAHTVILPAETVVSKRFERLQRSYQDDDERGDRVAFEELRTAGQEFIPARGTYVLLVVVSAVIATAGLLLDSAAIVVGSMVIAPLIGPILATSVGSVLFEEELFTAGLYHQLSGIALTTASASLFALLAKELFLVPPVVEITALEQVAGRLTPDLMSLAVAIGGGIAGARSLSSDISTGLVGVMIAAALVPPLAAVGIGIAWLLPGVVFNAGLLVLVNVVSINLAALATLWYTGYRPSGWSAKLRARAVTRHRIIVLVVLFVALSGVLAAFTVDAYHSATTTQAITSEVTAAVDENQYRELSVLDVQVQYRDDPLKARPSRVVVTVSRPSGREFPELADRLDRRIERRTDRHVDTEVRFVETTTGDSTALDTPVVAQTRQRWRERRVP